MEIREEIMNPEFTKYHLDGLPFDAVLHKFAPTSHRYQDHAQAHDHPWGFQSIILKGGYVEEVYYIKPDGSYFTEFLYRKPGDTFHINATHIHRIIQYFEAGCWTLILPGPWERESLEWKFENGIAYSRSWREGSEWKRYGN